MANELQLGLQLQNSLFMAGRASYPSTALVYRLSVACRLKITINITLKIMHNS